MPNKGDLSNLATSEGFAEDPHEDERGGKGVSSERSKRSWQKLALRYAKDKEERKEKAMSNERVKVNDSDLLASSHAGSPLSRRTFLKSLASAGVLLYVAPSTLTTKAASAASANAKIVLRWNDAMLAAIPTM